MLFEHFDEVSANELAVRRGAGAEAGDVVAQRGDLLRLAVAYVGAYEGFRVRIRV